MIENRIHIPNLIVVIFFIFTIVSPVIIQGIQSMDGNFTMTTILEEEVKRAKDFVDINLSKIDSSVSTRFNPKNFTYLLRNSIHHSEIHVPPPEV